MCLGLFDSLAALLEYRGFSSKPEQLSRGGDGCAADVPGQKHAGWRVTTLYATDRDTYVVQGWAVPGHEASVEIPMRLLEYVEANTTLAAV